MAQNPNKVRVFQKKVWDYYKKHKRDLPWRPIRNRGRNKSRPISNGINPYHILVSEIMLQQTQVDRVVPKYNAFIKKFPTIEKLARASQTSVLREWSGLGYNRRALYLQRTAEVIVRDFSSKFPKDPEVLETLPGIGSYTARAIATFSWNTPYTFIETNIRTAFIHEFFSRSKKVSDTKLLPLITKTLDPKNSREWYSALMDYGAYIKKEFGNKNIHSKHYTKQSKFVGSDRQIRGAILKIMVIKKSISKDALNQLLISYKQKRITHALSALSREGFVVLEGHSIRLV